MNLTKYIKDKFISGEFINKTAKNICAALSARTKGEISSVKKILALLEGEGFIVLIDGKFVTPSSAGLIKGVLRGNERGYAFLVAEDKSLSDFFIPNRGLHGAEHKDEVLAKKVSGSKGHSDEAEVVRILKRGFSRLTGTFYTERDFGFVRPDDKNYYDDIYISSKNFCGAKRGDKVLCNIISYPDGDNPEGVVSRVLGRGGDLKTEEDALILSFGLSDDFPPSVLAAADAIPEEVSDNQLIGRLDLTDDLIITIDGDDSKDFDDAVSVTKKENGNYILGVHIADVSQYIKRGDKIDKEAFERGTSVYFPDKVLPMIPAKLSDGLCSLVENKVRLTLSCIMEIDGSGEVVDKRIAESYIISKCRMTYKKVQAMLSGDIETIGKYSDIYPMIKDMACLRDILHAKREKRGSIDLETKEADIFLDGEDINVLPRTATEAYSIIEEFMIAANETVAEYAFYTELPFVYRVHEKPTKEKTANFIAFLNGLGISVRWRPDSVRPSDFKTVLSEAKEKNYFTLLNGIMLRSMQKAVYSPENTGHFGLSSKCYCHFTSPIRRYPDLVVHRILKMIIKGRYGEIIDLYGGFVAEAAKNSSEKEVNADEAERAVDDLYKTKYIEARIGEEFEAVISGVTPLGLFSELNNTIEGFTRIEDLPRGKYSFDENNFTLSSGKLVFKLGDRVKIGVAGADITTRRIDFIILGKIS
ncbi:MAG: ribonuclease R [Clostridia bacterium]|nr:ribonuclease R [Clostridia bacterium]